MKTIILALMLAVPNESLMHAIHVIAQHGLEVRQPNEKVLLGQWSAPQTNVTVAGYWVEVRWWQPATPYPLPPEIAHLARQQAFFHRGAHMDSVQFRAAGTNLSGGTGQFCEWTEYTEDVGE